MRKLGGQHDSFFCQGLHCLFCGCHLNLMSSLFLPLKNQVTLNNLLILSSEAHLLLSILTKTVYPILIWKFPSEGLKHLRIWFWCYHKKLNCWQTSIILYKMIIAILYTLKKKMRSVQLVSLQKPQSSSPEKTIK